MSRSDNDNFVALGDDSYIDWSVGVSKNYGGVDLALTYYGTDVDNLPIADSRIVFSISKSF